MANATSSAFAPVPVATATNCRPSRVAYVIGTEYATRPKSCCQITRPSRASIRVQHLTAAGHEQQPRPRDDRARRARTPNVGGSVTPLSNG
jgi:hypothetical protein